MTATMFILTCVLGSYLLPLSASYNVQKALFMRMLNHLHGII